MVEFATDKQKWLMNKEGIQYYQNTTKQEAKELIEAKLGKNDNYKPKATNFPNSRPTRDNKNNTFYVSYSKDVFLQLLESGFVEQGEVEAGMNTAISLVKQAINAFEHE